MTDAEKKELERLRAAEQSAASEKEKREKEAREREQMSWFGRIWDFAKDNGLLEVKALSFGNALLNAKELEVVAKLPTKDQAIALLMSVMRAPTTQFVRTMSETYAQFVRVLSAVADKKVV